MATRLLIIIPCFNEEDSIVFPTKEQEVAIQPPEDQQPEEEQLDPQGAPQLRPDAVDTETATERPAEIRFDNRQLTFY